MNSQLSQPPEFEAHTAAALEDQRRWTRIPCSATTHTWVQLPSGSWQRAGLLDVSVGGAGLILERRFGLKADDCVDVRMPECRELATVRHIRDIDETWVRYGIEWFNGRSDTVIRYMTSLLDAAEAGASKPETGVPR
jgi:hypothetical protein